MSNINVSRSIVNNNSSVSFGDGRDEDELFIAQTNAHLVNLVAPGIGISQAFASNFGTLGLPLQFNYEVSDGSTTFVFAHDGTPISSIWDDFQPASAPPDNLQVSSNEWITDVVLTLKIRGQFNFLRLSGFGVNGASFISPNIPLQMDFFRVTQWGKNVWCNNYGTFCSSDKFENIASDSPTIDPDLHGGFGYFLFDLGAGFFGTQEAADNFKINIDYKAGDTASQRMIYTANPEFTRKPSRLVAEGRNWERAFYYTTTGFGVDVDWANSRPSTLNLGFASYNTEMDTWNSNAAASNIFDNINLMDLSQCTNMFYMALNNWTVDFTKWDNKKTGKLTNFSTSFYTAKPPNNLSRFNVDSIVNFDYSFAGIIQSGVATTTSADNGTTIKNNVEITPNASYGQTTMDYWNPDSLPDMSKTSPIEWNSTFASRHSFDSSEVVSEGWIQASKSVKCMKDMFARCISFNQDVSLWDYSSLSKQGDFNQSGSSNAQLEGFLEDCGGFSDENLEKLLQKWALPTSQGGLPDTADADIIDFGDVFDFQVSNGLRNIATPAMTAAKTAIEAKGWVVQGLDYV